MSKRREIVGGKLINSKIKARRSSGKKIDGVEENGFKNQCCWAGFARYNVCAPKPNRLLNKLLWMKYKWHGNA